MSVSRKILAILWVVLLALAPGRYFVRAQADVSLVIRVNQLGYYPERAKIAAFHAVGDSPLAWHLHAANDTIVANGVTTIHGEDEASGDFVHQIDFSDFTQPGEAYYLEAEGLFSPPFTIGLDIYTQLKVDALRYFYLSRSGIELVPEYAGVWERPAGHFSDGAITCFEGESEDGKYWPGCDYVLNASRGWYDAGDYGKYVVNGGITLWTLLNQYEHNPATFGDGSLEIPESGNGIPDILDEARWQMEFILGMQVPEGAELAGMVHHKLHGRTWDALPSLPETHQTQGRYVYPPTTAATLNLAATAAQCARIWSEIDPEFSGRCLVAAERAWEAATAHPDIYVQGVPGTGGGDYGDRNVRDEFYWAAAELFVTTQQSQYRDFLHDSPNFLKISKGLDAMSWYNTAMLGTITLAMTPNTLAAGEIEKAQAAIVELADWYLAVLNQQGYRMPILTFEWGSNSALLNNMIIMGLAYDFSGEPRFLDGMIESLDYVLGRNPLGKSYVSGYGADPAAHPHHRFWANSPENGWPAPPPGVIAGGPNENANDPAANAANLRDLAPAKRYVDDIGSYSTNEVAINWNAPLAWVTAFLDAPHARELATPELVQEEAPAPATPELVQEEALALATPESVQEDASAPAISRLPWSVMLLVGGGIVVGLIMLVRKRRVG
ncbi:MAG: glycoside hydrolase family 9 protein [Anaerolineae bacterium]|nr:glycoside hydrolase family 9 protein [Anaerolineae bacterium]